MYLLNYFSASTQPLSKLCRMRRSGQCGFLEDIGTIFYWQRKLGGNIIKQGAAREKGLRASRLLFDQNDARLEDIPCQMTRDSFIYINLHRYLCCRYVPVFRESRTTTKVCTQKQRQEFGSPFQKSFSCSSVSRIDQNRTDLESSPADGSFLNFKI